MKTKMNDIKYLKYFIVSLVIAVLVFVFLPFTVVDTGTVGMVYRFGQITRVLNPGIHYKTPLIESVTEIDITSQKEQVPAQAASKDLQNVNATVAVEFAVEPSKVTNLYQEIGGGYKAKVIDPAVQEAVKSATAKYTAEELITKRELVREDIKLSLSTRLSGAYIQLKQVSIVNFDFSDSFNAAIEAKVTAEQNALAAKNKLEQVKYEAEQKVATAKAEAESIRLQSEAANNEKYVSLKRLDVELEWAKKWNGQYPQNIYASAPIPLLNLGK